MGKDKGKGKEVKMSRLEYERRVREVNGGERTSASSSDSETSRIRDTSAQNLGGVQFQPQNNGQPAQWAPGQPNAVTYDPSFSYYPQAQQPTYTARAVTGHELHHEYADRNYAHPVDRDLRGVSMNLPGTDPDAQPLLNSYARQTNNVGDNWNDLRAAVRNDPAFRSAPAWATYVENRIQYVEASSHQHNESVAAELIETLGHPSNNTTNRLTGQVTNALASGPVASHLRNMYNEALGRPPGGEVQRVPYQPGAALTPRVSAYTNTLTKTSGPARRK